MDISTLDMATVIAAGILAGFINTLAGSGSAITIPLLIFMGLPAGVANGTNRVAVVLQSGMGTWSFAQKGRINWPMAWKISIPAVIGALLGAQIAVDLDERAMSIAIGAMLVLVFFIVVMKPKRWLVSSIDTDPELKWWLYPVFFLMGIYGGFIQAGAGIFWLAALVLGAGFDLINANGIKNWLSFFYNIFAVAIFIFNDQVDWTWGLLLAAGAMTGAWLAAKFATKDWAQVWVYRLLLIVIVVSAFRMFYRLF